MKNALATMLLVGLLAPATAQAAFIDCDILSGQPVSCENGFEGVAVVQDRNVYRECTFRDGKATACGGNYDGRALVNHEGIFQMCDVADGKVYRCVAWAQGRAPQWKAEAGQARPNLTRATKKLATSGTLAPASKTGKVAKVAKASKNGKAAKLSKKAKKSATANRGHGRKANPS